MKKIGELFIVFTGENKFKLHSEYAPTGDQPQAIEQLVQGFREATMITIFRLRDIVLYQLEISICGIGSD